MTARDRPSEPNDPVGIHRYPGSVRTTPRICASESNATGWHPKKGRERVNPMNPDEHNDCQDPRERTQQPRINSSTPMERGKKTMSPDSTPRERASKPNEPNDRAS